MPALFAVVAVTAVWGVTFVQVKDAVALYPLFALVFSLERSGQAFSGTSSPATGSAWPDGAAAP